MEEEVANEEEQKGITLNIIKRVNKEWDDVESMHETFKVVEKY